MGDISVNINGVSDISVSINDVDNIAVALNDAQDVSINIPSDLLAPGPAFVSAEIGTVASDKLVITFDAAFNESITPAAAAFTITGITGSPTITVVGVSGSTVTLTLSADANSGDTITIGYTIPGSNPLQDADGKMSSTFAGESVTDNISAYCAEYEAVYDAYTTKPDAATAAIWNTCVETWVANGEWATKDVIYVHAAHTNGDGEALINWKNPGTNDATAYNAPTFTANEGFLGNGTTQYIDLNYNPTTSGSNFTQNSASFGFYCRTNVNTITRHGTYQSAPSDFYIQQRTDIDRAYLRSNDLANNYTAGNTDGSGFFINTRTAAAVHKLYRNKVAIVNATSPSAALLNDNLFILGANNDGVAAYFRADQISLSFAGAGMTQTHVNNFCNPFETAMDALGTGVIT